MNDSELFNVVLGQDEQILKTYRPNKFRAFFAVIVLWVVLLLCFVPIEIAASFDDLGKFKVGVFIGGLIFWLVIMGLSMLLTGLWCKKTVYAITNKRVLIRTGRIGVDYKSLDFTMLGAITVNVSWLDKLLHKNTGVIAFGSMSSPLVNNGIAKFSFDYIKNPYEVYKEVKGTIDANKDNK